MRLSLLPVWSAALAAACALWSPTAAAESRLLDLVLAPPGGAALPLAPAFSSDQAAYTATAALSTQELDVACFFFEIDQDCEVNGVEADNLGIGLAVATVPVTVPGTVTIVSSSPDGQASSTYTVELVPPSRADSELSELTPSAGSLVPAFDRAQRTYTLSVPKAATTITFTAAQDAPGGSLVVNGMAAPLGAPTDPIAIPLTPATTTIVFGSTSPDGEAFTRYDVTATRLQGTDASVSQLTLVGPDGEEVSIDAMATEVLVPPAFSTAATRVVLTDPDATATWQRTAPTSDGPVPAPHDAVSAPLAVPVGFSNFRLATVSEDGQTSLTRTLLLGRPVDPRVRLQSVLTSAACCSLTDIDEFTTRFVIVASPLQRSITVAFASVDTEATLRFDGELITQGQVLPIDLATPTGPTPLRSSLEVVASDGTTQVFDVEVFRAASAEAGLQSLSAAPGALSPVFEPLTLFYQVDLEVGTEFAISANPIDPVAAIDLLSVDGDPVALQPGVPSAPITALEGEALYAVRVTPEDSAAPVRFYELTVRGVLGSNNTLSGIVLAPGSLEPAFDPEVLSYTWNAGQGSTEGLISATTAATNATLRVNGVVTSSGTGVAIDLLQTAAVSLLVSAANGDERTYTLDIVRENAPPTISIEGPLVRTLLEDVSASIGFSIGDAETPVEDLVVTVEVSNADLFDAAALTAAISGTAGARTLALIGRPDAFGSSEVTLRVTDGSGASSSQNLSVTVLPVNDAPTFTLGRAVAVVASDTTFSFPGLLLDARPGPDNESDQTLALEWQIVSVSGALEISTISLDDASTGDVTITTNGADGRAVVQFVLADNGGTENGGIDRSAPGVFELVTLANAVGSDLSLMIDRTSIAGEQRTYRFVVSNNGPDAIQGVRMTLRPPAGLVSSAFTCGVAVSGTCGITGATADQSGFAQFDIEAGGFVEVRVSGSQMPGRFFVVVSGALSPPAGAVVLFPDDDRATLVDVIEPEGVFFDGFEAR